MKLRDFILFFFLSVFVSTAQDFKSRGDELFYEYAYKDAIKAYTEQQQKGQKLDSYQFLNLADSYFKSGDFQSATKIYLDINKKEDSIISENRFNNMLQSLAKISEPDRVKAFLKSKKGSFTSEFSENANFNYEILEDDLGEMDDFGIINLNINSPQADISPAFYKERLLFSTSRKNKSKKIYGPSGESYLNIYITKIGKEGSLLGQNKFNGIPVSSFHRSTPYYSESVKSIFYVLSNTDEDGNLVFSDKDQGKNALAIGLIDANGNFRYVLRDVNHSFYYPFYHDGFSKLYFAADFGNGYGGTDLYYVLMNGTQVMSQPVNLGPRVNTPGNEIAPFIYDNSLYFSSDVFYGLGGMDIYKANIQSDQSFGIPVNLGKAINSKANDFGFIIRENSETNGLIGYFSSDRVGGTGGDDIYGFRIGKTPGLRTLVFNGRVVNSKNSFVMADASVKVLDAEKNVIKEMKTKDDGTFRLEIPWRENVSFEVSKPKHSVYFLTIDDEEKQTVDIANLDIKMSLFTDIVEDKENKKVLKLDNFNFEKGKSALSPSITAQLDKVEEIVSQFPQIKFRIESHTSSKGGNSTNKRLSQQRVDAILSYLREHGVSKTNVTTAVGYGEEQLLNNCRNGMYCLDFLHKQNERTLFVVLNAEELNQ